MLSINKMAWLENRILLEGKNEELSNLKVEESIKDQPHAGSRFNSRVSRETGREAVK